VSVLQFASDNPWLTGALAVLAALLIEMFLSFILRLADIIRLTIRPEAPEPADAEGEL